VSHLGKLSGSGVAPAAPSLCVGLLRLERHLPSSVTAQGELLEELTLPCTMHPASERLKRSELAVELFGAQFIEG
jgi:glutamine synthetase